MEKTIIDWFIELEEPYRTQAIRNADKSKYNDIVTSMSSALSTAFVWKNTTEGFKYWSNLQTNKLYKR